VIFVSTAYESLAWHGTGAHCVASESSPHVCPCLFVHPSSSCHHPAPPPPPPLRTACQLGVLSVSAGVCVGFNSGLHSGVGPYVVLLGMWLLTSMHTAVVWQFRRQKYVQALSHCPPLSEPSHYLNTHSFMVEFSTVSSPRRVLRVTRFARGRVLTLCTC
jgi:hypothetical protein